MTLSPEARLEQVRAELDELRQRRNDAGLCGCPCGEMLPAKRSSRTRYLGERHRDAAHRERVKAEAKALGVPVRQSLESLETTARTSERRADAQAPRKRAQRRPRAGVSIYLPKPELVTRILEVMTAENREPDPDLAEALEAVRKARERLERRKTTA